MKGKSMKNRFSIVLLLALFMMVLSGGSVFANDNAARISICGISGKSSHYYFDTFTFYEIGQVSYFMPSLFGADYDYSNWKLSVDDESVAICHEAPHSVDYYIEAVGYGTTSLNASITDKNGTEHKETFLISVTDKFTLSVLDGYYHPCDKISIIRKEYSYPRELFYVSASPRFGPATVEYKIEDEAIAIYEQPQSSPLFYFYIRGKKAGSTVLNVHVTGEQGEEATASFPIVVTDEYIPTSENSPAPTSLTATKTVYKFTSLDQVEELQYTFAPSDHIPEITGGLPNQNVYIGEYAPWMVNIEWRDNDKPPLIRPAANGSCYLVFCDFKSKLQMKVEVIVDIPGLMTAKERYNKECNYDVIKPLTLKDHLDQLYSNYLEYSLKVSSSPSSKIVGGKKTKLSPVLSCDDMDGEVQLLNVGKYVSYKSSNPKFATVSSNGVVTTKKAGIGKTVTITCSFMYSSNKIDPAATATKKIKIKILKNPVKKITLKGGTVKAGKKLKMKAKVTAKKGANKTINWTVSNKKWAAVNSKGVVTAKKAGKGKTVTITATATDGTGKKAKAKVRIK